MLEKGGRTSKRTHLTTDGKLARQTTVENETDKLIPVIAKLCEQDKTVQRAFLCNPKVRHICKLSREGGFCGYRNIQMLVSYITKTQSLGHTHFPHGVPSILDIQDLIEQAWDMGFNSTGRTETGGIKGTRKFIGTPEVSYDSLMMDFRLLILMYHRHKLCFKVLEFRKCCNDQLGTYETNMVQLRCE